MSVTYAYCDRCRKFVAGAVDADREWKAEQRGCHFTVFPSRDATPPIRPVCECPDVYVALAQAERELAEARAEAARLRGLLRECETAGWTEVHHGDGETEVYPACPICGARKGKRAHSSNCRLAAALEKRG